MDPHTFLALGLTGLTVWYLGAFWPVVVEAVCRK
jgi:hypothetical protein